MEQASAAPDSLGGFTVAAARATAATAEPGLTASVGAEATVATPPAAGGEAVTPSAGPRRPHVLLAVTGSVATIKLPILARLLLEFCDIKVISTRSAGYFFRADQLPPEAGPVLGDEDEWRAWQVVGDPVIHIELRRWADMLVIAPLSANTLAKIAGGLCDNLLTCVVRAWDFGKPLLVAPAMNTFMWDSPFTARHLTCCQELGVTVIPPVSKRLACGDVGSGGMASPEDISAACRAALMAAGLLESGSGVNG